MRRILGGLLVVAILPVCSAVAQDAGLYREGTPPVLTPAPKGVVVDPSALAAFPAAYAKAGRPRIAVFWNRAFDDDLSSEYRERSSRQVGATLGLTDRIEARRTPQGASIERNIDAEVGRSVTTESGIVRSENRRRPEDENSAWRMETAFVSAFANAGAVMIDRAVIMRLVARNAEVAMAPDSQSIETEALVGKADLLVEILSRPSPEEDSGFLFRVSVKEIKSGRVLVTFSSGGLPDPESSRRFVATDRGFEPIARRATGEEPAKAVARETMAALARYWGR